MGKVRLHTLLADEDTITIDQSSKDELIEGNGRVAVELHASDFQFVNKLDLIKSPDSDWPETATKVLFSWNGPNDLSTESAPAMAASPLNFRLSKRDDNDLKRKKLAFDLDTNKMLSGSYQLRIYQSGKKSLKVGLNIHPPLPKIRNHPVEGQYRREKRTHSKGYWLGAHFCNIQ